MICYIDYFLFGDYKIAENQCIETFYERLQRVYLHQKRVSYAAFLANLQPKRVIKHDFRGSLHNYLIIKEAIYAEKISKSTRNHRY